MAEELSIRESFLDHLAERVGKQSRVDAVFGAPISQGSTIIVPVAKSRSGFGGGSGSDKSGAAGQGGGGGTYTSPIGYIAVRDGAAKFHRFRRTSGLAPLLLTAGVATYLVLRGLHSLVQVRQRPLLRRLV